MVNVMGHWYVLIKNRIILTGIEMNTTRNL